MAQWFLEGYIDTDDVARLIPLDEFPVLVGRQAGLALAGASSNMSRHHAEIVCRDDGLAVRDLGSKNGTFVNRERIADEHSLREGDVVHFADAEFRLRRDEGGTSEATATGVFRTDGLPQHFPAGAREIERLIDREAIRVLFEPIVCLRTGRTVAHECLARGDLAALPVRPSELLEVAASIGRHIELSELMRRRAIELADQYELAGPVFVNIHPAETTSPDRLLAQLWELRKAHPEIRIVLELHEAAITNPATIASLNRQLLLFGIGLAYDDFGAGQARLQELVTAPPKYLKFDIELVRDLDTEKRERRRMVELLVGFAAEMGIRTLAEGITRAAEARACAKVGFDLAQGYYYESKVPQRGP